MRKTLFKPNVSKTSEVVVQSYSTERKVGERLNDMGKKSLIKTNKFAELTHPLEGFNG